jgi:acyl-CoA reductase-like NAD-dependent aldehyde dehydrogenase
VAGSEQLASHSSSDGSLVCSAPVADAAVVDRAVQAASQAFSESGWAESRGVDRAVVLTELAARMSSNQLELATLISHEVGFPLDLTLGEIADASDRLRYFAGVARTIHGELTGASPQHVLDFTQPFPVGACALITPWNGPVDQPARQVGAALAAGCTVVIKPSELAPASTQAFVELFEGLPGLPDGVVNLIHGPGSPTGEALVAHPAVDKVSFTGSTETGRRILRAAATTLKRVSLECGGKTPCLVFSDCDLDKCADALTVGAFLYTGQSCSAATRVIADRSIYDEIVAALAARAAAMSVGDPFDPRTKVGPLVSEGHARRVSSHLESIETEGGEIVVGGETDGLFMSPVIVKDVAPTSRIATEEIFGPVLCVLPAEGEEEAVRIANSVPYGLQASVWTSDLNRALRVVRQLHYGDVWVNTHYVRQSETPFGGWKQSGLGQELGLAGVREYLKFQRVAIDSRDEFHLRQFLG